WEIRGIATATNIFMRSIGSALGVAFFGGMLNNTIQRYIEKANLDENITVDAIDKLLDTTLISTMSTDVIHVLQKGLIQGIDRKSTRLNSSHVSISYAVFCLKKKK